ncbi:MAG TPA: dTMP kinase [Longimicrobiales bacterium]|nr:dTMP kinase [Longimicrobiales bacterium]
MAVCDASDANANAGPRPTEAAATDHPDRRGRAARGLFVVLEGPEGSGKTTQVGLLVDWLEAEGIPSLRVREPGGTPEGEQIRRVILESGHVPARAELLLLLAARAILVEERIRPALEAGMVVVADRYTLSSLAYQGYGRGLGAAVVDELNDFATGGLRPDLTVLLDVPAELGEARRRQAGFADDRIEQAGREFHRRVVEAYRLLAQDRPDIVVLDGTGSVDEVQREVRRLLARLFPETFPSGEG